jgi:hypothetical protein
MLHNTASSSFLVQSYLSTILLFTGVYLLLFRLQPSMWAGVDTGQTLNSSTYVIEAFVRMLYFSVATMTGVGVWNNFFVCQG